jgi:hypothetical protein
LWQVISVQPLKKRTVVKNELMKVASETVLVRDDDGKGWEAMPMPLASSASPAQLV